MNENFVIWPCMANLNPKSHSLFPNAEKACNRFHKNEYQSSERSNRKISFSEEIPLQEKKNP